MKKFNFITNEKAQPVFIRKSWAAWAAAWAAAVAEEKALVDKTKAGSLELEEGLRCRCCSATARYEKATAWLVDHFRQIIDLFPFSRH